jgi:hypothetical protein
MESKVGRRLSTSANPGEILQEWRNPDLEVDQCKLSIGDAQAVDP